MLKSTQEKLQRQQERDNKVAFFEAQKENLKNRKADSLEEISEKLEMFHNYEDEIAAANQELLMEERRKELEKELEAAVQKARTGGLTAKEIRESFEIIMEDEVC